MGNLFCIFYFVRDTILLRIFVAFQLYIITKESDDLVFQLPRVSIRISCTYLYRQLFSSLIFSCKFRKVALCKAFNFSSTKQKPGWHVCLYSLVWPRTNVTWNKYWLSIFLRTRSFFPFRSVPHTAVGVCFFKIFRSWVCAPIMRVVTTMRSND